MSKMRRYLLLENREGNNKQTNTEQMIQVRASCFLKIEIER
jgi:hypothetical protein